MTVFGISKSKLYGVKNAYEGRPRTYAPKIRAPRGLEKSSLVTGWIKSLFDTEEHMPHQDQVHISYPDKKAAYRAFMEYC